MAQDNSDFYASNLSLLKTYHPEVWAEINESRVPTSGEICFSSEGIPNLKVEKSAGETVFLHNEANPRQDTQNYLNRIPEDEKGFVSILGMGLGYGCLDILEKRPYLQRLALFELDPGIFIQALHYNDFSNVFKDPRLILRIGTHVTVNRALEKAAKTIKLEDSRILHHQASFEYDSKGYTSLKSEVYNILNQLNVEGTTNKQLGREFLKNRLSHMTTIHYQYLLEQIENAFEQTPAILVAGGPSLDKNIHLLKQAQNSAVIIAADTVLPVLLENGVSPHFMCSIDPNNLTFEKFADYIPKIKDVSLVCSSTVNIRTAKAFPAKKVFWTYTAKAVESWLNGLLGGKTLTKGASTVAHLSLTTAEIIGCNPVIFIGQDLAYPTKASHAKGTVLHGTTPTEDSDPDELQVRGVDGGMLRTDRGFLSMKKHFEEVIACSAGREFINSTEGGAHIEGTKPLPFQSAIDKYCTSKVPIQAHIEACYDDLECIDPGRAVSEFTRTNKTIKKIYKWIKQADALTNSILRELPKLKKKRPVIRSFSMLPGKIQQKISKIDNCHQSLDNQNDIWSLLEEITLQGLKESERQKTKIAILEKDPLRYLDWLEKNFERLSGINAIRKDTAGFLSEHLQNVLSFWRKEKQFNNAVENNKKNVQAKNELISLYVASKNYQRARPIIDGLYQSGQRTGDLFFYSGCTCLESGAPDRAGSEFQKALEKKPELLPDIQDFRTGLGDEFFSFVQHFKTQPNREASIKYVLKKGLRYCPDHDGLNKELVDFLDQELKTIEKDEPEESLETITAWQNYLSDQATLLDTLPNKTAARLFQTHAKFEMKIPDYDRALDSLNSALKYSPQDETIHTSLIDTYFMVQDFNNGISALNRAVKINRKFADYWNTIGNSLSSSGQYEDALIAYENCFTHLPEQIELIKKMGDCYLELGQLEAAKLAYENYKMQLEKN